MSSYKERYEEQKIKIQELERKLEEKNNENEKLKSEVKKESQVESERFIEDNSSEEKINKTQELEEKLSELTLVKREPPVAEEKKIEKQCSNDEKLEVKCEPPVAEEKKIEKQCSNDEKLEVKCEPPVAEEKKIENKCSNDEEFWKELNIFDINLLKKPVEYLLHQFGTRVPCNRFDIGNCIEFIICNHIKSVGFKIIELTNAKRFDVDIDNYKKLSIKYSSIGDITLHNSNSCINKDIEMKDTILLTPDKLYLITNSELSKHNININDYLKNSGDSLKLKRKILVKLEKINYPYITDIKINHNKEECLNRLCSKVFYDKFIEEYLSQI